MKNKYEMTLAISVSTGFLREALQPLVQGTTCDTQAMGVEAATNSPLVKFTGVYADLLIVIGRAIRNDEAKMREMIERIRPVPKVDEDRVGEAATRVRRWLAEYRTLGGIDQTTIHTANHAPLFTSDVTLLLDALGRDR